MAQTSKIDVNVLRDPSWWHWAVTVGLLAVYLAGAPLALLAAAMLCAVMAAYYATRLRALRPFPVQIRLVYLGMLLAGLVPGMVWLHWVQLIGTSAMVLVGYCALGRLLSLIPLNRQEPFAWGLVRRTFLSRPSGGVIRLVSAPPAEACVQSCSLRHHAAHR